MDIPTCDIGSFDDFLSYLRAPPVDKYDIGYEHSLHIISGAEIQ